MASSNGTAPDPSHVAVAAGLGEQTPILAAILAELRTETAEVGVSDATGREMVLDQHPVAGCKRILAYRTGNGFGLGGLSIPTTGVLALPANEARVGLTFINAGANAVILFLAAQQQGGCLTIWLAGNGGAWDGLVGGLLWCGNVFAVAQVGATTLYGGEL